MEFQPIERAPGAFQMTVTADQIRAICHRAFGSGADVVSAVELGNGMYNSTYRVGIGEERPVILRVAPEPARQSRIERHLMRNEHASIPYLAPIAPLMPRVLAADFTHQLIGRDYLLQTMVDGIPAPESLGSYPRTQWPGFFRQMGEIAHGIHDVRGAGFGPVAHPVFSTWSDAVISFLEDSAADLDDVGLDAGDVREVAKAATKDRALLDEITEPRLLHGDLWTVNVMLAADSPTPMISGVFDCDRASWGDPAADWTIFMAARRPGTERDAFWEAYGPLEDTAAAQRRALFYRARHIGAIRLERHRMGRTDHVPETYAQMGEVLTALR